MQFYRRWSGRTLVFAGLTTALAMGIIGSCSRKIIVQSRVSALDARAQPFFNKARSNVPGIVKKLTTVGSLCRICWYMPRDKLTGSHKAQEYLSSVMKEPIMDPCRQGAQIYGCKLNSAGFLKLLKEINADYYKTRQEIEQSFKSFDDTLDASASYMRNQYAFEAWLFINHLALQLFYSCLRTIADAGMTDQYAFDDLIHFLKGVRINKINGQWVTTKITKQTEKCCKALGITFAMPERIVTP